MITAILTSRLTGPIAAGVAVLLLIAGIVQTVRLGDAHSALKDAQSQVSALTKDNATLKANVETLNDSLLSQNAAIEAARVEGEQRVAAAQAALAAAQKATTKAQAQADKLLSFKPTGNSLDERVRSVDVQVMESLK